MVRSESLFSRSNCFLSGSDFDPDLIDLEALRQLPSFFLAHAEIIAPPPPLAAALCASCPARRIAVLSRDERE